MSLALYIHWPFCVSKCPYCDFNSHVREQIPEAVWRDSICRAIDFEKQRLESLDYKIPEIGSIFFGGGTPSLMAGETVAKILDHSRRAYNFADDIEITLEANPNSVDAERFRAYSAAGVNRISIGVQSLDRESLKFLGRSHSADDARRAISLAQSLFPRVSFDLIYSRPQQTVAAWQEELSAALAFGTEHLSLYQLTIEAGTAFAPLAARGDLVIPDDEQACELYLATEAMAAGYGLPAYEISNYAKSGCESRHNLTYWHYGDYIGIGPGAHGRQKSASSHFATRHEKLPETWLKSVAAGNGGLCEVQSLTRANGFTERLMMGLRLTQGIEIATIEAATGCKFEQLITPEKREKLIEAGYLYDDIARLKPTLQGRLRLNAMIQFLLPADEFWQELDNGQ